LFWVKCCLLILHPLNQLFDPIKDWLICEPGRQQTVMLDLAVEFGALLTHGNSVFARAGRQLGCCLDDGEEAGLFYKFKLGHL
jgi:hypothetical protein